MGDAAAADPVVSVVIPAFNAAATLDATLRSVRSQTHRNLEILVVDDGSADATPDVADRHARSDSRVVDVGDGVRRGRSAARNRAIELAAGEWIAFVDADDLWRRDRVASLLGALRRFPTSRVAFDDRIGFEVVAGRVRLDDRFVSRATWRLDEGRPVERRGWLADKLCHMDPLVHRTVLEGDGPRYPEDLSMGEDLCFCMQVAYWPQPTCPVRVGRPGYYYRMGASPTTAGSARSVRRAIDLAVARTGDVELASVSARAWPGIRWRMDRLDRQMLTAGRNGPPDEVAVDPARSAVSRWSTGLAGVRSLAWDKGLHTWAHLVDRSLRPGIERDIREQLRPSGSHDPTSA